MMNQHSLDVSPGASVSHSESTQKEFTQAVRNAFPLSVSVFTYGIAYGALAHTTNHLDLIQTLTMSIFVFAGASQFTILALMHQGAAVWTVISSVFFLNSRQILYGLSLGPYTKDFKMRQMAFLAHGLTDESFSVSIIRAQSAKFSPRFFLGAGSAIFIPWLLSSLLGFLIGGLITDPSRFGLDFAYIGAFLGLLVAQLNSLDRVLIALMAGGSSIVAAHWLGTSGAVVTGAFVSFLFGVMKK
jgi:4-azaleucine resistance transporter AzlC